MISISYQAQIKTTRGNYYTSIRMDRIKNQTVTSADKDTQQVELSHMLVGTESETATMGKFDTFFIFFSYSKLYIFRTTLGSQTVTFQVKHTVPV